LWLWHASKAHAQEVEGGPRIAFADLDFNRGGAGVYYAADARLSHKFAGPGVWPNSCQIQLYRVIVGNCKVKGPIITPAELKSPDRQVDKANWWHEQLRMPEHRHAGKHGSGRDYHSCVLNDRELITYENFVSYCAYSVTYSGLPELPSPYRDDAYYNSLLEVNPDTCFPDFPEFIEAYKTKRKKKEVPTPAYVFEPRESKVPEIFVWSQLEVAAFQSLLWERMPNDPKSWMVDLPQSSPLYNRMARLWSSDLSEVITSNFSNRGERRTFRIKLERIEMLHVPRVEQTWINEAVSGLVCQDLPPNKTVTDNMKCQDAQAGLQALTAAAFPRALADMNDKCLIVPGFHGHSTTSTYQIATGGISALPLRKTDGGYFGAGLYTALEPTYAARYAMFNDANEKGEYAMLLFAILVGNAYVVTQEKDYPHPHYPNYSKFFSFDPCSSVSLMPGVQTHFVPTKWDARVCPERSKHRQPEQTFRCKTCPAGFQACPANDREKEGHEIIVGGSNQLLPLAVYYFKAA